MNNGCGKQTVSDVSSFSKNKKSAPELCKSAMQRGYPCKDTTHYALCPGVTLTAKAHSLSFSSFAWVGCFAGMTLASPRLLGVFSASAKGRLRDGLSSSAVQEIDTLKLIVYCVILGINIRDIRIWDFHQNPFAEALSRTIGHNKQSEMAQSGSLHCLWRWQFLHNFSSADCVSASRATQKICIRGGQIFYL